MKLLRAFGVFVSTMVIYLGLPWLGWSVLNSQPFIFFSHLPIVGYAVVVTLFSAAVGIQAYSSLVGIQDGPGSPEKTIRRQDMIGTLLVVLLLTILFILPLCAVRSLGEYAKIPFIEWIGVPLCGLGYGLVFWSGLALGRQYSARVTIQEGHQLITSGPYRWIRHPRYLGILCLALGYSLIFSSWIGLAACFLITSILLYRIKDEETLLADEFGEVWKNYCLRSWRLIPYIY